MTPGGGQTLFVFDFDGVITVDETLAVLDRALGLGGGLAAATYRDCRGIAAPQGRPESLGRRLEALAGYDVEAMAAIVAAQAMHGEVTEFIGARRDVCAVLTSNVAPLCGRALAALGCRAWSSECGVTAAGRLELPARLLDKGSIVARLRAAGHRVVMTGDGANDIEAMRQADVAVAAAYSPAFCREAGRVADMVAASPSELVGMLGGLA